jgi:hypothetical protein
VWMRKKDQRQREVVVVVVDDIDVVRVVPVEVVVAVRKHTRRMPVHNDSPSVPMTNATNHRRLLAS